MKKTAIVYGIGLLVLALCVLSSFSPKRAVEPAQPIPKDEIAMAQKPVPKGSKRDFEAALSDNEKRDISYIVTTLARKSAVSLLFYKKSLEEAGDRVAHVHPLKFLGFIFTDSDLKKLVKEIKGTPWNRFSGDMGESLRKAYVRQNLSEEYLHEFTEEIGIDYSLVKPYVDAGDWQGLINKVRDLV